MAAAVRQRKIRIEKISGAMKKYRRLISREPA